MIDLITAQKFTDRDLIESILNSYFIVDYGYVSQYNTDGTVNIVHARKGVMQDGTVLPEYREENVELLTLSCAEFSISCKAKSGDGVLILGLKDQVKTVEGLTKAEENTVNVHYDRSTVKAIPLSLFNAEAKVKIVLDNGNVTLDCQNLRVGNPYNPAFEVIR